VAFSPDAATLASANGEHCGAGQVIVWDAASGQRRATLPGGTTWVAFSPDGMTLASGVLGGSVALWDPATGRRRAEMSGHVQFTRGMAFLPDGKTLASCNFEGSVTIWDVVRGQERALLRKSEHSVWSLAVSPDGRTLATGGEDGEVEFWRASDEHEVRTQSPVFDFRIKVAGDFSRQGTLLQDRGQDKDAQKAYLDAVALYESAAAEFPGRTEYRLGLAATYRHLLNLMANSSQLATQDCSRVLALADKAIELTRGDANPAPEDAALWHDKGKLLEKVGQPTEALEALTKAIELVGANTNAYALTPAEARLSRSGLLMRMNRLPEAVAERCQALTIPLRNSQAKTNLVDLSPFYNASLNGNSHGDVPDNNLAALPTGIQTLAGTEFDIRGLIQASQFLPAYPALVTNIPVGQVCQRLHFLHAAFRAFKVPDGTQIGRYVVHYVNGQQREIPLVIGQDLADWWEQANEQGKPFVVAWTGTNAKSQSLNRRIRLFKTTWPNPRLDVAVQSIDFEAMDKEAMPFLVAITVE